MITLKFTILADDGILEARELDKLYQIYQEDDKYEATVDGKLLAFGDLYQCLDACNQHASRFHNITLANVLSNLENALDNLEKTRNAIRKHRDQRGDDRCWMDDEELYNVLPEGYTPPARDTSVELKNCEKFIACRHHPDTVYVSPEREIEKLREEIKKLSMPE